MAEAGAGAGRGGFAAPSRSGSPTRLTPELNPDEGIWNDLKRVELANLCAHDLAEVALALRRAKERLRHKRSVIQACIRQAGYHV